MCIYVYVYTYIYIHEYTNTTCVIYLMLIARVLGMYTYNTCIRDGHLELNNQLTGLSLGAACYDALRNH